MNIIRSGAGLPPRQSAKPPVKFDVRQIHTKEPKARARTGQPPWRLRQDAERAQAIRKIRAGKPFLAWDGEGCVEYDYVLLGHSDNQFITGKGKRLSTIECLSFIWEQTKERRDAIHVTFGFNYDVDNILRDLPSEKLRYLKEWGEVAYAGFKIRYIPWKMFSVTKGRSRGLTLYDTMTFFQTSLIKAAEQYVPDDPRIAYVHKGKDNRDTFTYDELEYIIEYWQLEGELMCSVMNALRRSTLSAGISLKKWHGPGAVAETLIEKHKLAAHIIDSRNDMPLEVTDATAYSFFGGRFECRQFGRIGQPVYTYDINSAYPTALARMPMLVNGQWQRSKTVSEWGLYHVVNHGKPGADVTMIGPLPCRTSDGNVYFPLSCEGWYYGHEVLAAMMTGWDIEVLEGWEYRTDELSAFMFLEEMFNLRREAKAAGNPAQLAYKLGMNSLYGKLAQLIGWDQKNNLPPKFHHQWYAGQTTSWTRARIYLAMMQAPDAIISCETDSVASTVPLNLKEGSYLGEWESGRYDDMVYVQSGIYFAAANDGWTVVKTRGTAKSGPNKITVEQALKVLPTLEPMRTVNRRYGGMSGYIDRPEHWQWFDQPIEIKWGAEGKRRHDPNICAYCLAEGSNARRHVTVTSAPAMGLSFPRSIPWIDGRIHDENEDTDQQLEEWSE